MSAFFEIFKTLQVITIKHRRFRLRTCFFEVLALKYKQSGLSKNAETWFWTESSVKYDITVIIGEIKCMSISVLELWKGNTKVGKQGARFLYSGLLILCAGAISHN